MTTAKKYSFPVSINIGSHIYVVRYALRSDNSACIPAVFDSSMDAVEYSKHLKLCGIYAAIRICVVNLDECNVAREIPAF